ncbi:MAG: polyprenyl synthetase family protein [Bacteroidota bacterium]
MSAFIYSNMNLSDLKQPIQKELDVFDTKFREYIQTPIPLLDKVLRYMLKRKGKQVRPMFVFLAAKIFNEATESTYRAAALIELLHSATLIHDDVVDNSDERRGFFSLNAIWKNKISVLSGDFLLSRGMLLALENKDYPLLEIVSRAVRDMSEGELLQYEKARKLDITEELYFEVIRRKTATLFGACCACGSLSAGCSEEISKKMYRVGELLGTAFQIRDDVFDYRISKSIGKPTGLDIREQKVTLPLIYALQKSDPSEKKKILRTIKHDSEKKGKVEEVIRFVNEKGGISMAQKKMDSLAEDAIVLLKEVAAPCAARDSFENLILFTIQRNN